MNGRIEAAAKVLSTLRPARPSASNTDLARAALKAADEAEAPLVEQLAEALNALAGQCTLVPLRFRPQLGNTRVVLAAFHARRADQ